MAALTAALLLPGTAAQAKGPEIGGAGSTYYLNDNWTGAANISFSYGRPDDRVYVGDWNADGRDTLAVRRGATYYLTNALRGGAAETVFTYGRPTDQVLVGDWNGDGRDTLAVRRGNTFYFTDTLRGGTADTTVAYGRRDDQVYTGDWNGDGIDTPVVRRGSTYYVTDTFDGGAADRTLTYGRPTDHTLIGDWNADTRDTLGVRRPPAVKNPTQQWADQRFGSFTPLSVSGTGDSVVKLPSGARSGLLTAQHDGQSYFVLETLDAAGEVADQPLYVKGGYEGTVPFGAFPEYDDGNRLHIIADGAWTVTIAPMSTAPGLPRAVEATIGSRVFLYGGASATLDVRFSGLYEDDLFIVYQEAQNGDVPSAYVYQEAWDYNGRTPLAPGPSIVYVLADPDGNWELTVD
ncbi:hypothetical protein [Microbacterium gilvum]|uniref:hypothetical protein n=1 Tax=Microbacterium gilvum TaxID=1336204 RepID=UPI0031EE90D2